MPYGFGNQQPIVPPSLNDLNLPPNPFNVLATMAVIRGNEEYSPQSPEPSVPSPSSTPPINVSIFEGWDTPHTTTDDATFYTDDEPRKVYWHISSSDTFDSNEPRNVSVACLEPFFQSAASTKTEKEAQHRDVFSSKEGSVAAHLRGMRPILTERKATQCLEETQTFIRL